MSKPKTFRPWNPEQTLLLPPSPVEWLPANHLVFFLLDMAAELDLSAIYAVYEARDPRGVKAYEPRMMVVLLLYAYCVGIPSSRRIERACWEDAAFRVLTGNQQPDHSRISDFRLVHLDALAGLFMQVLRLCQKAGLVSLGNVALDGTKVKANASKHKAMSHERMLKTEAQLEAEIAALLRKAELIDAQEDARYGKGKRGDELPKELELRQDRLDALRKAKSELEAEAPPIMPAAVSSRLAPQKSRLLRLLPRLPMPRLQRWRRTTTRSMPRARLLLGPLPKRRNRRSAGPAVPGGERSWPASWRSTRPRPQASQPRIH
jgi:transposase